MREMAEPVLLGGSRRLDAMDWFQVVLCAFVCARTTATPPPGYVKTPDIDEHPPKYEFGYSVRDGSGGSQGHLETRDGEFALGKYFVNLPSNQQKVDYFADDWGYHPLVEYKTSSGSSSMSTQFAMGEKAVAALSRQHGVEPPLEILKTKSAESLIAGVGPQISIKGSSGVIPGPSDEPIHNSLDGETYPSSTIPSYSTTQASQTPSTLVYDRNTGNNYQQGSYDVSSVSSVQPLEVQSTTERYLGSSAANYEASGDQYDLQKNTANVYRSEAYTQTTPSNSPGGSRESKEGSYTDTSTSSSLGQYEKPIGNFKDAPEIKINYQTSAAPAKRLESSYENRQSYSTEGEREVTSFVADANSDVSVKRQGESVGTQYSPNTRISTVFNGETGNTYEDNEIRSGLSDRYISSTTASPPKTVLKPIVVNDYGDYGSSLALFSAYRPSTERYQSKFTKGKLYHREGRVKSELNLNVTPTSVPDKTLEYYSTPAPTPEPVLVTPRLEASRLTSSGNILAPLQAGLSLQHHTEEDCDDQHSKEKENFPSSGPDVEKQVLREEAVYKTTIDVQKSIPFEIHPEEEKKYAKNIHGSEEQNSFEEGSVETHQQNSQADYNQVNTENVQGNYNHVQTGQSFSTIPLGLPIQSEYGAPANHYNQNNFIQQVIHAYHRMANNLREQSQQEGQYPIGLQTPVQPFYVPNKLYYVYLQGYNPYLNRYGQQQPVYTNYNSPNIPTPSVEIPSNAIGYSTDYIQDNKGSLAHEYKSGISSSHGNLGYSMVVNHEDSEENKAYGSLVKGQPQGVSTGSQDGSYDQYEAAKDFGSGLNELKESERDLLRVHPNNKHVQYSTGHGEESSALTDSSYQINGNSEVQSSKDVNYNDILVKDVPVAKYITKLIQVEKPEQIPHPAPVHLSQVPVPQPYPVIVEKPVKYASIGEKPVPYAVTKLLAVERPVPVPYAVPQLLPYPQMVPVPVKGYRPVFLYRKPTGQRLLHREALHSKNQASFRPSQPVFGPHPPETYHVMSYFRGPSKRRGNGRQLCIEYGGFKPPLVPSVQVDDEPKPSYGPPTEEKKD